MSEETTQTSKKYYDNISVGNRTEQIGYFVQQHDKNKMFVEVLSTLENKQILVLVKSKVNADKLLQYLKEKELKALAIHGNHKPEQIKKSETAFNSKDINILITTDRILEKLSLSDVQVLVNYDLPLNPADYFRRLLLVDEVGTSISLIDPEDERVLASIELMMKCEMLEVEIEGFEHTKAEIIPKDKTKKPRHKKVEQRAKKKADMKAKWIPREEDS